MIAFHKRHLTGNWLKQTLLAWLMILFMGHQMSLALELPETADITTKETLEAAHSGDVEAMYSIALYLLEEGQRDKPDYLPLAFGWSLNAARNGHAQSAELTGVMYRRGIGVDRNFVKARKWLERAVARGSMEPNFELALLYSEAENPGANKSRAAAFLADAIRLMEPRACLIAARNKINGGIEIRKALNELRCAANGGIVDAMIMLAQYHLTRRSPYSQTNARNWLQQAAELGSDEALLLLSEIE
ncbi:MAG: tetratricopeptide repeat protein [Candidatus Puniceispirillaceae bacterium]